MARPLLCFAVLSLALAGCFGPGDDGDDGGGNGDSTSTSSGRVTSTGVRDEGHIVLNGSLVPFKQGFVANVSAFNDGPDTYGVGRSYCVSNYGAWTARLDGPPGEGLVYRDPDENQLGCAGQTGIPMPPGTYVNWTYSGDWARGVCNTRYVCDNVWDGDLGGADGERTRAPAGTYTWRFTFTYSVGASGGTPHIEREGLDLTVELRP